MDIKKAIEEEKRYIKDRVENNIDTSLIERLSPFGYTSLDRYFADKKEYLLRNVDFKRFLWSQDMITLGREAFERKIPYIFIPILEKVSVWHGLYGELDREVCKKLDIDIFEVGAQGGTIITTPEDLSLEILVPKNIDINAQYFLDKFYNFYKKYFDDVVMDGNDILINGVKVQGTGSIQKNEMMMFLSQVSFSDSTHIIERVCLKESSKQAGWIDNSILTKEELYKEVMSWLQEQ